MRILILDGDSNAGCAILQSLGRSGYECWLAAHHCEFSAFRSRYVTGSAAYPAPLDDKTGFVDWLLAFQRQHQFDLIIPPTDITMTLLHELRDREELDGILALPPAEAFEIAVNKERVRQVASKLGIPTPPTVVVSHLQESEIGQLDAWLDEGAVVVKSFCSKVWNGRRGYDYPAAVIADRDKLRQRLAELLPNTPVQVQKWVPGRGQGVELLADRGRVVLSFAHERLHEMPLTGGGSSYRRSIEMPPRLLDEASQLMRELRWHGVAMVEFRVDTESGQHWLMEINGRFWGSLPLAIFAGVDFPTALVQLLRGHPVEAGSEPRAGVYARRFARDLEWTKAIVRRKLRRPSGPDFAITRPLGTSLLEWSRVLTGKEIWDGARLDDPGPIVHEVTQFLSSQLRGASHKATRRVRLWWARPRSLSLLARAQTASKILVLCKGNICRSPYAERRLKELGPHLDVRSAGFLASGRSSPSQFAEIARRRGVDLTAHRSSRVNQDDLDHADLVLIMDDINYTALTALHAPASAKAVWLGALDSDNEVEITDPFDASADETEVILNRIDRCVRNLAQQLSG